MSVTVHQRGESRATGHGFAQLVLHDHDATSAYWIAGCAVAGMALGAIASRTTRHYVDCEKAPRLSSTWFGALVTGTAAAVLGWRVGEHGELAVYVAVAVLGVPLGVIDWVDRRLPRRIVLLLLAIVATGLATLCLVTNDLARGLWSAAAMLAVSGFLLLLALIKPGGIGAGDIRLAAVAGLVTGWSGWPSALTALILALSGAYLLALVLPHLHRDRCARAITVPLGPWLLAAILIPVGVAGMPPMSVARGSDPAPQARGSTTDTGGRDNALLFSRFTPTNEYRQSPGTWASGRWSMDSPPGLGECATAVANPSTTRRKS